MAYTRDDFLSSQDPKKDRAVLIQQSLVLARLLENLELEPKINTTSPDGQRQQHITRLMAVASFLETIGDPKKADYFYRFACAISDLEFGIVAPFLKASPRRGKPPEPSSVWFVRSQIALGIAAYMRAGLDRRRAAATVESYCRSVGTSTQFLTWYDDFNSQRVRNKIAVSVFEDGIKLINSIPESEAGPLKAIGKKLSTAAAHRQRSH